MGSEFSKQEEVEFGQYRNRIDEALRDQDPYPRFRAVRDQLAAELRQGKPNVERYVVAYVKQITKSSRAPNSSKFNALLLLKELMKTGAPKLLAYNSTKFMPRLQKLAASKLGPKVLLDYNSRSNAEDSGKFHRLLLESLQHWGDQFGATNPVYADARNKLTKAGLIPVPPAYYDLPREPQVAAQAAEPQVSPVPDLRKTLDAFKFERVKVLELMRYKGQEDFRHPEIETEFRVYQEERERLDRDPFVQSLLLNQAALSPADQELAREFGNEIMMYDMIRASYHRVNASDPAERQAFFKNVEDTHKNLFGSQINMARPSRRDLHSPIHEEVLHNTNYNVPVMQSDRGMALSNGPAPSQPARPESNAYVHEDYARHDYGAPQHFAQADYGSGAVGLGRAVPADAQVFAADYDSYAGVSRKPENDARVQAEPQRSNVGTNKFSDVPSRRDVPVPVPVPVPVGEFSERNLAGGREYAGDVDDLRAPQYNSYNFNHYNYDGGRLDERKEAGRGGAEGSRAPAEKAAPKDAPAPGQPTYVINHYTSNYFTSGDKGAEKPREPERRGWEGQAGRVMEARSFEEEPQQPSAPREAGEAGRAGRVGESEGRPAADRQSTNFRLNNLRTEASVKVSKYLDDDVSVKNPFKPQGMSNSKEFYKNYFRQSGGLSERKARGDLQFRTEAINFVNRVYDDINNTVAR